MGMAGILLRGQDLTSLVNLRTKKLGGEIAQLNVEQFAQNQYLAELEINLALLASSV